MTKNTYRTLICWLFICVGGFAEDMTIATPQDAFTADKDVTPHGDTKKSFKVSWSWVNKGVAPCYPGGYPALTLKDEKGGIVSVLVDETLNLRDLKVGPIGKAPVKAHDSEFIVGLYAPDDPTGHLRSVCIRRQTRRYARYRHALEGRRWPATLQDRTHCLRSRQDGVDE